MSVLQTGGAFIAFNAGKLGMEVAPNNRSKKIILTSFKSTDILITLLGIRILKTKDLSAQ